MDLFLVELRLKFDENGKLEISKGDENNFEQHQLGNIQRQVEVLIKLGKKKG